jgi:hypothetical protein
MLKDCKTGVSRKQGFVNHDLVSPVSPQYFMKIGASSLG